MLENGNLISLIWNKSSHLEGMALTQQRGSTRHTRVEFIFEVSGIYRGNLEAHFSFFFSFFVIFAKVCLQGRRGKCFSIFLCVPAYLPLCKTHFFNAIHSYFSPSGVMGRSGVSRILSK